MPKVTLTYFDFAGSRGEECRLALHLADVPFEDERITFDAWPARKATTPFGALPVLTVEGHPPIAQTNAILRLVGHRHGLHPKDDWEAAKHEALMGAVEDLRARLGPLMRLKDEAEKKRAREEMASTFLREWGTNIEKQIGDGPFVAGSMINVVDLKLFVALSPFMKGTIDYIPADTFKPYPKLMKLFHAVKDHPKVVAWYAK
jgi:glutathione S-transferase